MAEPTDMAYHARIESLREREYPMLKDQIYLDHAGTTLYSRSLMERFSQDMINNLYGNPHSQSTSSQLSTRRVEDTRLRALRFFQADPECFDLVFVANATAGIKLVMDAMRSLDHGFDYVYHKESHTSLVGVRENAQTSLSVDDEHAESWLAAPRLVSPTTLFAYPAQSNMNGRRLPLRWLEEARQLSSSDAAIFTLLDAAALVSTSPMDFSMLDRAPDFCVLSYNKIFGFPDLGALIIRKSSAHVLRNRKYFGGGTVDAVLCDNSRPWHAVKENSIHEVLEDGTLPIHSIMALDAAFSVHSELFQSMQKISDHCMFLARRLYSGLSEMRHANGSHCCQMYSPEASFAAGNVVQGPVVTFNLKTSDEKYVSNAEVEKLAAVRGIHIRTGGLCNPGGIATSLGVSSQEVLVNHAAGFRCGNDNDIMASGKPSGMIRASIGATSITSDVDTFLSFVKEFYCESATVGVHNDLSSSNRRDCHYVESLTVYPIKSCGGYNVPDNTAWIVKSEGLAWDREWCLVHRSTGQAMSQKRYPKMALIRPTVDLEAGMLDVQYVGHVPAECARNLRIPLSSDPSSFQGPSAMRTCFSKVCGDSITARTYLDSAINDFFSTILEVPCALARFPAGGSGTDGRHAKAHMQRHQKTEQVVPRTASNATSEPPTPPDSDGESPPPRPILLSNESPILIVNRDSVTALNMSIAATGGKQAHASVFRANILVASSNCASRPTMAEMHHNSATQPQPYQEDKWRTLKINNHSFTMLGACRRCHMVCIDQDTAVKDEEPFVTLARTRRFEGKVFFGCHMCLDGGGDVDGKGEVVWPTIRIGDLVHAEF